MSSTVPFIIVGMMASIAAFYFFRKWIKTEDALNVAQGKIRKLEEFIQAKDKLNDPAAVDRVLDAIKRNLPDEPSGPANQ